MERRAEQIRECGFVGLGLAFPFGWSHGQSHSDTVLTAVQWYLFPSGVSRPRFSVKENSQHLEGRTNHTPEESQEETLVLKKSLINIFFFSIGWILTLRNLLNGYVTL